MNVQSILRGIGLFLFLAGLAFPGAASGAEPKIVRLESRTFPNPAIWDSNYTACLAASDGRVYVGLNYHGGGASVAVYDPKTDTMKILGDMNRIVGQTNLAVEPQAKVHSQICEGPDGKIYFGTSLFNQGRIDERGKDVLLRYKGYEGPGLGDGRLRCAVRLLARNRRSHPASGPPHPLRDGKGI